MVKAVEIIGEAAGRVTDETQRNFPSMPWRDISAMRNRLIHAYFDINLDILWNTIMTDVPQLAAELRQMLESPSPP